MTDVAGAAATARNVNIDSAIGHSSYQLPVFVALSVEGGEVQVRKTFATARDVFGSVFSVMLDRLRQRRAVEKVERLVPTSAHVTNSADTEYVLFVRGKAIFWFSSAAAKRAAGRQLLLEHARELADAERAPFYVLNSRARKVKFATMALGLVALFVLAALVWQIAIHGASSFQRNAGRQGVPSTNTGSEAGDGRLASEIGHGLTLPSAREPIADFDVPVNVASAIEAVSEATVGAVTPARRLSAGVAGTGRSGRTRKNAFAHSGHDPDWPLSVGDAVTGAAVSASPAKVSAGAGDRSSQGRGTVATTPKPLAAKASSAPNRLLKKATVWR